MQWCVTILLSSTYRSNTKKKREIIISEQLFFVMGETTKIAFFQHKYACNGPYYWDHWLTKYDRREYSKRVL